MKLEDIKIYDIVMTPNGKGVVHAIMTDGLVAVKIPGFDGHNCEAGHIVTGSIHNMEQQGRFFHPKELTATDKNTLQPIGDAKTDNGLRKILESRAKTHGNFEQVADAAQHIKNTMHESVNWASNDKMENDQYEALEMIASKLARILCGKANEPDHWRDIAGYAMLVANRLEAGK